MTTRETSRIAYQQLVDSGQLKGRQAQALNATIKHGPATSAEIIDKDDLGENVNLWRARFTELQARGLIREVGQRKCKITGHLALVWEATGRSKPLDVKKGHKAASVKELRAIAVEAIDLLVEHHEDEPTRPVFIRAKALRDRLASL